VDQISARSDEIWRNLSIHTVLIRVEPPCIPFDSFLIFSVSSESDSYNSDEEDEEEEKEKRDLNDIRPVRLCALFTLKICFFFSARHPLKIWA
jgi:hypothetical protein